VDELTRSHYSGGEKKKKLKRCIGLKEVTQSISLDLNPCILMIKPFFCFYPNLGQWLWGFIQVNNQVYLANPLIKVCAI